MNVLKASGVRRPVGILLLTALANAAILWNPSRLLVFAAGALLLWLLPGFLLTQTVLGRDQIEDWLEVLVLTVGFGLTTLILGTLGLHYVPGPLELLHILVLYNGVVLALLAVAFLRGTSLTLNLDKSARPHRLVLLGLVLVAILFRLANLGYSEFQGDEARAMLMAGGVIRGEDGILFLHRKGPAEILIPAAFYALAGTTNELVARLPFSLAGITAIVTIYLLARRLFAEHRGAALTTLGVLAVDGYLIAFGRIVQYQSIVVLMMALTAWCTYGWYAAGDRNLLWLASLFLAVGTLAHYEALFVAPFVAWLVIDRAVQSGWSSLSWLRHAVGPALVLVGVLASFYAPFVLHPQFEATASYLAEERVGGASLHNNLADYFWRATFYSSTYYVVFLILAVLALVAENVHRGWGVSSVGGGVFGLCVLGMVIAASFPNALMLGDLDLSLLPFAAFLAVALASPESSTELRAALIWFALPSLFLWFLTRKPKNHGYILVPAWGLLVGAAVTRGTEILKKRATPHLDRATVTHVGLAAGVVLLAVFGTYEYTVLIRHEPNYLKVYPEARLALYPSVHGDELPRVGFFGFPHRSGLKAAGALRARGLLQGSYDASAEPLITSWYTRRMAWCPGRADYYLISDPVQDEEPLAAETVRAEESLLALVRSGHQDMLEIYARNGTETPRDYDLADLVPEFDTSTAIAPWLWSLRNPVPTYRVEARLGRTIELLGYDVLGRIEAGKRLPVMLYWQSSEPIDHHYNVFVHVEVPGQPIWGQSDGTPGCGSMPTTAWESGATVVDGHSLSLDASTPPGTYPLLVGLYDPMTGERLPVEGRNASKSGNAVMLGTVEVVALASTQAEGRGQL